MQNRKRDTDVHNRLLGSMGEGEGGMFRENSIETCILSRVKQITNPVGCMKQVLRAGALGRPRGMGWWGRREGGLGWGTHVSPWLIHVNVWQNPLQYGKVISLQLIKINENKQTKDNDNEYCLGCGEIVTFICSWSHFGKQSGGLSLKFQTTFPL